MSEPTPACHHCGAVVDVASRQSGDRVWHQCGGWYVVTFTGAGVARLAPCNPPVSYPRAPREAKR